jgi:hypothetical protein
MVPSAPFRIPDKFVTGTQSRFVLPVILFLFLQLSAFCSEKEVSPTFAKEASVQVLRGSEVEIVLEAIPDYGNPISFEIQSNPHHGQLSNLTSTSDHTAVVTYRHDGTRMPLADEFQFRAQSPGRAKSPATRVSIEVIPPPVRLEIDPGEVNFGALLLGDKRQTNITIRNLGGVKAVGRLVLPSGYSAPEGAAYSLDEGEVMKIVVEFSPQEEKDYAGQADSQPEYQGGSLLLKGEGLPQFDITKKDPLTCSVTNRSDEPLRLSFVGDPAWIIPPVTALPPHAEKDFSFQQAEYDEETFVSHSSEIQISDGSSTRLFELPPVQEFIPLTVTAAPKTNLGTVSLGSSQVVNFSILNRSEMGKNIRWMAESTSGGGMPSEASLTLVGGEYKDLHYEWLPTLPGEATLKITVKEGTKTTHELLWKASVTPDSSAAQASSSTAPEATQGEEENNQTVPVPGIRNGTPLAPVDGLSWKEKSAWNGKPCMELHWTEHDGNGSLMKIEQQVMRPKTKSSNKGSGLVEFPFEILSVPLEVSSSRRSGSEEVREIQNLPAGWHLLVLTRVSKEGTIEAQSQIQVFIPQQKPWWHLLKIPAVLLLLLLLATILWKQKN